MSSPSGPKQPPSLSLVQLVEELKDSEKTFQGNIRVAYQARMGQYDKILEAAQKEHPIPLTQQKSFFSKYSKIAAAGIIGYVLGAATCEGCHRYQERDVAPVVASVDAGPADAGLESKVDAGPKKQVQKKKAPAEKKVAKKVVPAEEEDFGFEVPAAPSPVAYDVDVKGCPSAFEKYMNANAMPEVLTYFNNQLESDRTLLSPKDRLEIKFSVDQGIVNDEKSIDLYRGKTQVDLPGDKLKTYTKLREYVARLFNQKAKDYFKGNWACKPTFTVELKR